MTEEIEKKSAREEVLDAIRSGEVQMRPRWQFVLRGTLAVLGGVLIALVLLYLVSLIIFTSRQTGAAFVPAFGLRGIFAFLRALPWLLITLSLVFIVLLEILVRRYSFAYRRPLIYSGAGIIVVVVAGGFLVASTSLHHRLFDRATSQRLPSFARVFYYIGPAPRFSDIHRGVITSTTTRGFIIQSRMGEKRSVAVASGTQITENDGLELGDMVVIFGPEASDTIEAIGVRKIKEKD